MSRWLVWMALVGACTKKNPDYCAGDSDCQDPTRPFCDVQGAYPESGNQPNHCSVVPANCPLDRCGCTPGAAVSCQGDQLATCNADGQSTSASRCALGCATDPRCLRFEPSNGLAGALGHSAGDHDVILPKGVTIETDGGVIRDSTGAVVDVATEMVGAIRVFEAKSFIIDDARANGSAPLAFVASGRVQITGLLDVGARGKMPGPGAHVDGSCAGGDIHAAGTPGNYSGDGPGGGGHATTGGAGGGNNAQLGAVGGIGFGTTVPLTGGCRGGNVYAPDGSTLSHGGAGGGGIEIVSNTSITFGAAGFVRAGGGGGEASAGGGSGGLIILEAPVVAFTGSASGLATNGGSGGCPNLVGKDGMPSATAALGCGTEAPGSGGTGLSPPQMGYVCVGGGTVFCISNQIAPGGGGAGGATQITTQTGAFDQASSTVISSSISALRMVVN